MNKPLTLKQLIQIVPLDEKVKQSVLNEEERLTADQKYKISKTCWRLLSTIFISRIKNKKEEMIKKISQGEEFNKEDFKRIEDEVLADILIKLDEVKSEEEIKTVKKQIEKTILQQRN